MGTERGHEGAADVRALQSSKIKELRDALVETGFLTLDEQARALGLARSTTWAILQAKYKNSGLTASIISRMLVSPRLPPRVRATIQEYVDQKIAGLYGHGKHQRRKFAARLSVERANSQSRPAVTRCEAIQE